MIYYRLAYVIFAVFIVLSSYFAFKKKYVSLFTLLTFSAGISGFNIYLGTLWHPYKIVSLIIFTVVLININNFKYPIYFKMLIILFIFSLLIALIFIPSEEPEYLPLFQRKFVRPFLQLISYGSVAAIIPFAIKALKDSDRIQTFFKNYYTIVEFIMAFALLQFILIKFGIDFMPIIRPNVVDSLTSGFSYGGLYVTRLYGISGEAKTLAAFLFPYFFISLYNFLKKNYNKSHFYHLATMILSLFVIINSYSSAILISLVFCILFMSVIWFRNKLKFFASLATLLLILQYVDLGRFSLIKTNENVSYNVYNMITLRTVTRMQTSRQVLVDYKALEYLLKNKPFAILSGVGLGMYPYYLQLGGRHGIDPIDSSWMAYTMDFGLIGVCFFLFIIYKMFEIRKRKILHNDILFNSALIGLFASYFAGLGIGTYFYMIFFLALTLSVYKINIDNSKINSGSSDGVK